MSKIKKPQQYNFLDSTRTDFHPVTAFCSKVSTMRMAEVEVVVIRLRYCEPGWST